MELTTGRCRNASTDAPVSPALRPPNHWVDSACSPIDEAPLQGDCVCLRGLLSRTPRRRGCEGLTPSGPALAELCDEMVDVVKPTTDHRERVHRGPLERVDEPILVLGQVCRRERHLALQSTMFRTSPREFAPQVRHRLRTPQACERPSPHQHDPMSPRDQRPSRRSGVSRNTKR